MSVRIVVCTALVAVLLSLACAQSKAPTGPGDDPAATPHTWQLDIVDRSTWGFSVWAASPGEAFAGNGDRVFHYRDGHWAPSLWSTGLIVHDVWGLAADAVYAVGTNLFRYDGSTWLLVPGFPGFGWSLWGSGADDLWVCDDGQVHHWNGSGWATTALAAGTLWALWGSGPGDVFAVGADGAIFRYDGLAWSPMSSGTNEHLWDVWGSGPGDVWVATDSNALLHFNGSSWSEVTIAGTASAIWGRAVDDVYALLGDSSLLHYDGLSWSPYLAPGPVAVNNLHGAGDAVFAAGNNVGVFADSSWTTQLYSFTQGFEAVGGSGADNLIASAGRWLWTHDGSAWRSEYVNTLPPEAGPIWTAAPYQDVLGRLGNVYYRNSAPWQQTDIGADEPFCVWGNASTGAFLGCSGGRIYRTDAFGDPTVTQTLASEALRAIWGFAADDVWAVGDSGTLLHFYGGNWSPLDSGTGLDLLAVWGSSSSDLWVAGVGGVCRHWDGATWTTSTFTNEDIQQLVGWASDAVVAYIDGGTFLWDGEAWSAFDDGWFTNYTQVHLAPDGARIAVDERGWVYRGVPE